MVAAFSGIGAVLIWVAFWSIFVPEVFSRQIWAGHEVLVVPIFFIAAIVGPLFFASAGNIPTGGRRRR